MSPAYMKQGLTKEERQALRRADHDHRARAAESDRKDALAANRTKDRVAQMAREADQLRARALANLEDKRARQAATRAEKAAKAAEHRMNVEAKPSIWTQLSAWRPWRRSIDTAERPQQQPASNRSDVNINVEPYIELHAWAETPTIRMSFSGLPPLAQNRDPGAAQRLNQRELAQATESSPAHITFPQADRRPRRGHDR